MKDHVITFRSITPAQRAERALNGAGISCYIQRTPKWMANKGCGYSLRLSWEQLPDAVEILRQKGIAYQKIYRYEDRENVQEVPL